MSQSQSGTVLPRPDLTVQNWSLPFIIILHVVKIQSRCKLMNIYPVCWPGCIHCTTQSSATLVFSYIPLLSIKLLKQRDRAVRLHLPHYWRDAETKAELGCYFVRKGKECSLEECWWWWSWCIPDGGGRSETTTI